MVRKPKTSTNRPGMVTYGEEAKDKHEQAWKGNVCGGAEDKHEQAWKGNIWGGSQRQARTGLER